MFRFIENLVANANIKKCEKDLEDTTIMDIYEVDTAVKMGSGSNVGLDIDYK